jgi:uncharacterized protein involved in outer membrane biogenesis
MAHTTALADPAARPDRRRRPWLWAGLVLPAILWTGLYFGGELLKRPIERRASDALGRAVTIGGDLRIALTPFSIYLTARDVRVDNPDWAQSDNLLRAGSARLRFATFDLLIGRYAPRAIALGDGTLDLERSADGRETNWTTGRADSLLDLTALRQIATDHILLRYRDPSTDSQARLALSDDGRGAVRIDGEGAIGARRFTLDGRLKSGEDRPAQLGLTMRTGDVHLSLAAAADTPLRLRKAGFDAVASGGDFAGLASLAGVALPAMPDYRINARIGRLGDGWHFSHIAGRIGGTDLAGKLTLDRRKARPVVVAQLASRTLDIADAKTMFGLTDGSDIAPDDDAFTAGPSRRYLLPDAALSPEALRRFDAVVDYKADRIRGTDHASAHLSMRVALIRGILSVSPASVDLAGGFVSSELLVDARRTPVLTRADIRLSPTPMGRLLRGWGVSPAGTTAMVKARVQLSGRGATLREAIGNADGRIALILPAGQVRTQRASASSLDMTHLSNAMFSAPMDGPAPTGLNCGLIAFTVRNGVATADPILIDTDGNILSGSGRIDLRDERLDLRLAADGKALAWFGRPHPVTIGGTFTDPVVARAPVSWFRPTRLFGLAFGVPDLGAIFGFVDPGEADAPACGPILRGDTAEAQHERGEGQELASLR